MDRETLKFQLPVDLRRILASASKARVIWDGLTPIAQRDFISWIDSAKQPETRRRRVESIPSRLASGKRRPCCYALVPMNLYKAIGASPKAKAVWRDLTPDERRDFVGWIDAPKESKARGVRIVKVCAMLASGKRHP